MIRRAPWIGVGLVLCASLAGAQELTLEWVGTGGMQLMGSYMPQRLALSAEKPAAVTTLPADVTAAKYGTLSMGPKDDKTTYTVLLDEPADGAARLFVDADGDGDLTNDLACDWTPRPYKTPDGTELKQHSGGATVVLPYGDGKPAHLAMYRFDPNDPGRAALKDVLLYYADYAIKGTLKLGDTAHPIVIADRLCTGDFAGEPGLERPGVVFMIDVNGNGEFDSRGEMFDVTKPFNLKGTTYELAGLTGAGDGLTLKTSAVTVEEVLPPPNLNVGNQALPFEVTTLGGNEIKFPETFKGKLVLLDFWATWCGPCRAEIPGLVAAYGQYQDRGFEVLGISLDQADKAQAIRDFCTQFKMPWDHVYDGKYWQAEISQLYGIDSIPRAILVDGDTGQIVAYGNTLRGQALAGTIDACLKAKGL